VNKAYRFALGVAQVGLVLVSSGCAESPEKRPAPLPSGAWASRSVAALWDVSGSFAGLEDANKKISEVAAALGPGDQFLLIQVGGAFDERTNVVIECTMPEIPAALLSPSAEMRPWKEKQIQLAGIWSQVEKQRQAILQYLPTVKPSPKATTPLDDAFSYAAGRLERAKGARYLIVFSDLIQDSNGVKRDGPPSGALPLSGVRAVALFVPWASDWKAREQRWAEWFRKSHAIGFQMFDGAESKAVRVIEPTQAPRLVPGRQSAN